MALLNKFISYLGSKALSHKIKNADTELLKSEDMVYLTSGDNNCMEIIVPNEPIEHINEFNLILDILSKFDKNEKFNSYPPVRIKAFSKEKNSIIGYTTTLTYVNRSCLNLDCKTIENFKTLVYFLEYIMYLTDNNVSLKNIEISDFVLQDKKNSFNNYYIRFPHKLEIDAELDPMENVRWFLKNAAEGLCSLERVKYFLENIYSTSNKYDFFEFEKNFFFSNKLLGIYESVFKKQKKVTFSYIFDVLKEDMADIKEFKVKTLWKIITEIYNGKKYLVSPYLLSQEYQNLSKDLKDRLCNKSNIIFENQHFFISYLPNGQTVLIYKEYTEEVLTSIKALASILKNSKSTTDKPFGIEYFVYSSEYDHPIGFAIDKKRVSYFLNDNTNTLKDTISDKGSNLLIRLVSKIFDKLEALYNKYNCSFVKNLKVEDIIYSKVDNCVYINCIYNICADDDPNSEIEKISLDDVKTNIVLEILKEDKSYTIKENNVIFDETSKILAFSPIVIEEFKNYLLTDKIDNSKFLKAIENTITNYTVENNIYYYKNYVLNPYKTKICFKEDIEEKTDSHILVLEDLGINIGNSKRATKDILHKLKELDEFRNSGIVFIDEPYELVYERKIINKHDMYRLYGILYKKSDDLYKLSNIQYLYSFGIFDNKQLLDIIINLLDVSKHIYINKDIISITHDFKPCIQESVLIESSLTGDVKISDYNSLNDQILPTIRALLHKLGYLDIIDDYDRKKAIIKLKNIRNSLDTKCSKHNFWYNNEDCCSICHPNSTIVDIQKLGEPSKKNSIFKEYIIKKNNQKYLLRLFRSKLEDKEKYISKLQDLMQPDMVKKYGTINLLPLKKVLNPMKMQEVIGYITKPVSHDIIKKDFLDKISNKDRLKCINNLIEFIRDMNDLGISIDTDNDILNFIDFTKDFTPVITDPMFITKSSNALNKNASILEFIRLTLLSCNVSELNDETAINEITNNIQNGLFPDVIRKLNNVINNLDCHCKKHNHYYKHGEACSECWGPNIKTYSLEKITACDVFSEMGKEAIVYDLDDGMLGKVYRTNKDNEFENELDIDKKEELIKSLIAKENLNNPDLEKAKNFEIVNVQSVILDENGHFRGIVIKKVLNAKSIKLLTDRAQIEKYNITREDIFNILISIGYAINWCHENGIYIGDISYNNILFNIDTKKVYLIDIDSVNLKANENTVFTDIFVDPLAINKNGYAKTSFGSDWYAYAILCFYTLTLLHPFNGVYPDEDGKPMKMPKRKVKKISVLGKHNVKVPAIALSWDFMSDTLINAFLDIFERDKRYDITKYIESNYLKLFGEGEPPVDEKESEKSDEAKDNNIEIEVPKCHIPKKDNGFELFSVLIEKAKTQDEKFISRGVSVIGEDKICHNSVTSICGNHIKNVYACSTNCIYVVDERNKLCLYEGKLTQELDFSVVDGSFALAVPYSNTILFITLNHENECYELMSYNSCNGFISPTWVLGSFDNMPKFILSLNSRHGYNNVEKISKSFLKMLTYLTSELNRLNDFVICADLITDKWLLISSSQKEAYVFDPKTSKGTKVNIPFAKLQSTNFSNIIFFNNAIYYPCDGKICSLNVFNLKYLEFNSDKVFNTSRIEIVKDGFRVFNKNSIYDIKKK